MLRFNIVFVGEWGVRKSAISFFAWWRCATLQPIQICNLSASGRSLLIKFFDLLAVCEALLEAEIGMESMVQFFF